MSILNGKVALVTGAGRGIGRAIAQRLAADGAIVAVNYLRDTSAATAVVDAIGRAGGTAFAVQADIGQVAEVERMFATIDAELHRRNLSSRLDILVNNAGMGASGTIAEADEAVFDLMFDTNVKGTLFVTRAGLKRMGEGRIVMISSVAAAQPWRGFGLYAITKAAVNALTRTASVEVGARGITVNAVMPGFTETDLNAELRCDASFVQAVTAKTLLGRWGTVDDIANVVAFLAGPDAAWVTGQDIEASGGINFGH